METITTTTEHRNDEFAVQRAFMEKIKQFTPFIDTIINKLVGLDRNSEMFKKTHALLKDTDKYMHDKYNALTGNNYDYDYDNPQLLDDFFQLVLLQLKELGGIDLSQNDMVHIGWAFSKFIIAKFLRDSVEITINNSEFNVNELEPLTVINWNNFKPENIKKPNRLPLFQDFNNLTPEMQELDKPMVERFNNMNDEEKSILNFFCHNDTR